MRLSIWDNTDIKSQLNPESHNKKVKIQTSDFNIFV